MSPRAFYRTVAVMEAITWAGLIVGMLLKYTFDATEMGVTVFGPLHGVVFIAFCLATLLVGIDQRWPLGRVLLGLLSAIPPFTTLVFEWYVRRAGGLGEAWRLSAGESSGPIEGAAAWLIRNPVRGIAVGAAAVAVLTAASLGIGI